MKPIWALIVILACFGIVGRIDYEASVAMAQARLEYQHHFHQQRAAAMAARETK